MVQKENNLNMNQNHSNNIAKIQNMILIILIKQQKKISNKSINMKRILNKLQKKWIKRL